MSTIRKKIQLIKCGKIEYILGRTNKKWAVSVFTSKMAFQKTFSNKFARKTWILEHISHENDSVVELTPLEQKKYESRLIDFLTREGKISIPQH